MGRSSGCRNKAGGERPGRGSRAAHSPGSCKCPCTERARSAQEMVRGFSQSCARAAGCRGMKGLGMHRGRAGSWRRRRRRRGQDALGCSCSSPGAVGPRLVLRAIQGKLCLGCSRAAPALCKRVPLHLSPLSCPVPGELSVPQAPPDHCTSVTSPPVAMEKPGCPKHDPLASSHVCQEMKVL